MRNKVLKTKNDIPPIRKNIIGLLISGFVSAIISVLFTFIFSYIFVNTETISESLRPMFIGCILLAGFFCGVISSRLTTFKGLISGIISSSIYLLIITIIMLFFSDGRLSANMLFMYFGAILVSGMGGICGANIKRRK